MHFMRRQQVSVVFRLLLFVHAASLLPLSPDTNIHTFTCLHAACSEFTSAPLFPLTSYAVALRLKFALRCVWTQRRSVFGVTTIIKTLNEGICLKRVEFLPPENLHEEQWSCSGGIAHTPAMCERWNIWRLLIKRAHRSLSIFFLQRPWFLLVPC